MRIYQMSAQCCRMTYRVEESVMCVWFHVLINAKEVRLLGSKIIKLFHSASKCVLFSPSNSTINVLSCKFVDRMHSSFIARVLLSNVHII